MLMNVAFLCTVSTDLIACSCPHVSKTHAFRCTSSRWRPQPREVTPNDEMWCWFCCSIYYFYKLYLFIHVSDKIHKLIKGYAYNKLLFWITTFTLIMYYQSNNSLTLIILLCLTWALIHKLERCHLQPQQIWYMKWREKHGHLHIWL